METKRVARDGVGEGESVGLSARASATRFEETNSDAVTMSSLIADRWATSGVASSCPPLLDVALCESGDMGSSASARIRAHAGRCSRCAGALADLRKAREEVLGSTPLSRSQEARAAARAIEEVLKRRYH